MQKYCKKGIQTNKNPAPAGLLFLAFNSTLNGFIDWTPSVSQGLEMALKRDNGYCSVDVKINGLYITTSI
jgi:hypothetical protein